MLIGFSLIEGHSQYILIGLERLDLRKSAFILCLCFFLIFLFIPGFVRTAGNLNWQRSQDPNTLANEKCPVQVREPYRTEAVRPQRMTSSAPQDHLFFRATGVEGGAGEGRCRDAPNTEELLQDVNGSCI